MNALQILEQLANIHSALWSAHSTRMKENGNDDIAKGLASCATFVGDAATTLSAMQAKMAGQFALSDMVTGRQS
jgi:hypothetical protein